MRAAAAALRADCVVAAGCTRRIGTSMLSGVFGRSVSAATSTLRSMRRPPLPGCSANCPLSRSRTFAGATGSSTCFDRGLSWFSSALRSTVKRSATCLSSAIPSRCRMRPSTVERSSRVGERLVDARGEVEALDVEDERGRACADRQVAVDELARVVLQGLARLLRRHAGDVDAADDRALRQAAVRTGQRVGDAADQDHAQHRAEHEQPPATLPAARLPVAGMRARGRAIAVPWRSTSSGGPLRPSCRLQLPHGAHHCTKEALITPQRLVRLTRVKPVTSVTRGGWTAVSGGAHGRPAHPAGPAVRGRAGVGQPPHRGIRAGAARVLTGFVITGRGERRRRLVSGTSGREVSREARARRQRNAGTYVARGAVSFGFAGISGDNLAKRPAHSRAFA